MITIYGIEESDFRCGGCIEAKRLLDYAGLDYEFKRIIVRGSDGNPEYDKELLKELKTLIKYTTLTLPYVFSDSTRIPLVNLKQYLIDNNYQVDD